MKIYTFICSCFLFIYRRRLSNGLHAFIASAGFVKGNVLVFVICLGKKDFVEIFVSKEIHEKLLMEFIDEQTLLVVD